MLLKLLSFTLTGAKSICKNIITTLSMHEWVATTFNMVEEECLKSFVGVVIVNVVIIIEIQLTMLNLFVKCITFQRQASDSATRTLSKINRNSSKYTEKSWRSKFKPTSMRGQFRKSIF